MAVTSPESYQLCPPVACRLTGGQKASATLWARSDRQAGGARMGVIDETSLVARRRRPCACLLDGQSSGCNLFRLQNESNLEAPNPVGMQMHNLLTSQRTGAAVLTTIRKSPRTTK